MIVAIAALVPPVFVVIAMVIAVIITFTVTVAWRNDTGRHNRHQSQQNACRNNAMHIRRSSIG
jgi:hypothetical protein